MKVFLLHTILMTMFCCLWFACTDDDRAIELRLFGNMDSLLEANPDSAYVVLTDLEPLVDSLKNNKTSMRYQMYMASTKNKLFMQLPSDSFFQRIVDYYDRHGNANDHMRSRYLMGCIYRDQNEAPQAIRYFQEAAECADTSLSDCDYATLLRIYSQMGFLYYSQYFPDKSLACYRQMSRYALKAKDTDNYILGIYLQTDPYYLMADTAKILEITDSTYHLYMKNNMPEKAARVFIHSIYIQLKRENYSEARRLMNIFEQQSGVFTSDGTMLEKGYERYDYARGLYCLSESDFDSAMIYFQRLLNNGLEYEAYDGLARLYRMKSDPDSAYKYMELTDKKLDAQLSDMQIQAITLSNSMYDYSRIQHESEKLKMESDKKTMQLWVLVISTMSVLSFLVYRYCRKQSEMKIVRESYREIYIQYRRMQSDYETLSLSLTEQNENSIAKEESMKSLIEMVKHKESEISRMKRKIEEMKSKYSKYLTYENINEFMKCSSVQKILSMTRPFPQLINMSDALWDNLLNDTSHFMPSLYLELVRHNLSKKRCLIAVMVTMGLTPSTISTLLGTSIQSVSKQQACINDILFGKLTSKTLRKDLLSLCV